MSMCEFRNILFFGIKGKITRGRLKVTPKQHRFEGRMSAVCVLVLGSTAMALSIGLSGCGSDSKAFSSTTSSASTPALVVSPSTIDFGDVNVGTPVSRTLSITNQGTSAVQVAQVSTSTSAFTVNAGLLPASLPAGGSMEVQVRYDPGSAT